MKKRMKIQMPKHWDAKAMTAMGLHGANSKANPLAGAASFPRYKTADEAFATMTLAVEAEGQILPKDWLALREHFITAFKQERAKDSDERFFAPRKGLQARPTK